MYDVVDPCNMTNEGWGGNGDSAHFNFSARVNILAEYSESKHTTYI